MVEISTSILSINKEESIKKFYDLEVAHTDYFHIDVMDGKFVQNNTSSIMQEYTNIIKQITNTPLDVHLMVEDVKKYVDEYLVFNPNRITFHYEALKNKEDIYKIIEYIKNSNVKVGLAINPITNVENIYEFLPYIHMILVMSVVPGKGGQKLIPETLDKVRKIKKYILENEIDMDIEIDGGVKLDNIDEVKNVGVDIAVVGSGIVSATNYVETMKKFKK